MNKTLLIVLAVALFSCAETEQKATGDHIEVWHKNATIYEVNVRQYTQEGTFAAFLPHVDRIHEMGIDILWFMPIHPIGEHNRKGGLGSYYSVKDYKGVNSEHGTDADFQAVVDKAHSLGMKVILDWVANHSAWDNEWAADHKDWYTPDSLGNLQPPLGTDWWDVADLNYDNPEMRLAMIDAMKYWVEDFDIDGFRCDVASWVPNDFWSAAIDSLHAVKPVFMLAEADDPSLHDAGFDMTYTWEYMHVTNEIAAGKMVFDDLDALMAKEDTNYTDSAYRLYFTTNHDENSWKGDVFERYGDTHLLQAVLAYTIGGMPLLYSGQEAGLNKRLEFFEKDQIDWGDYEYAWFYSALLKLNQTHRALWNGEHGGRFEKINSGAELYCYKRVIGEDVVVVFLNFSSESQSVEFESARNFTELFSGEKSAGLSNIHLAPLEYKVFYTE